MRFGLAHELKAQVATRYYFAAKDRIRRGNTRRVPRDIVPFIEARLIHHLPAELRANPASLRREMADRAARAGQQRESRDGANSGRGQDHEGDEEECVLSRWWENGH